MSQMGSVTDKLTAAKITEVLSQAQAQAKMLKVSKRTWVGRLSSALLPLPFFCCSVSLSKYHWGGYMMITMTLELNSIEKF